MAPRIAIIAVAPMLFANPATRQHVVDIAAVLDRPDFLSVGADLAEPPTRFGSQADRQRQ
jgi:hypothetical protein